MRLGPIREIPTDSLVRDPHWVRQGGSSSSMGVLYETRVNPETGETSRIKWLAKTGLPSPCVEVSSGWGPPPGEAGLPEGCELLSNQNLPFPLQRFTPNELAQLKKLPPPAAENREGVEQRLYRSIQQIDIEGDGHKRMHLSGEEMQLLNRWLLDDKQIDLASYVWVWRVNRFLTGIEETEETITKPVLREICANDIYKALGCYGQQLAFSRQAWMCDEGLLDEPGMEDVKAIPYPVHLMSKWMGEVRTFGQTLIDNLRKDNREAPQLFHHCVDDFHLPLPVEGLGHILAVAWWLNDYDCLGSSGGNVGYTILRDAETNRPVKLQALKLDPGCALADEISRAPPVFIKDQIQVATSLELPHLVISNLSINVRVELCETLEKIVRLRPEDCEEFFKREGLALLFDADEISKKKGFLQARQRELKSLLPRLNRRRRQLPALPLRFTPETICMHIKNEYRPRAKLRDPITGKQFTLESRYVNLLLLKEQEDRSDNEGAQAEAEQAGERETMLHSFEAIRQKKESIALADIFSHCQGGTRQINMPGGAGIGKSTLCQHLVSEWANNRLWQGEYSLVIWVPLRHLNASHYPSGNAYDLISIIAKEACGFSGSGADHHRSLMAIFNPDKTLWILDGYDEALNRVPRHLQALLAELIAQPHRLLTSRPQAIQGVQADVTIEIAGFTDENVTEYVQRFDVDSQPPESAAEPRDSELLQQLNQHVSLWQLAHVPINCVLLCHVMKDFHSVEDAPDKAFTLTLTQVYRRVERLLWQRYCQRLGEDITRLPIDEPLPDRLQLVQIDPLAELIADIALRAMRAGVVLIPGNMIIECMRERGIPRCDEHQQMLMLEKSGVFAVSAKEGDYGLPDFYFLHLTLQEYFAAKAIAARFIAKDRVIFDWVRKEKYTSHYEIMWGFVSGLLGIAAKAGNHMPLENYIEAWLAEPRDLFGYRDFLLFIPLVSEGQLMHLDFDRCKRSKIVWNHVGKVLLVLGDRRLDGVYKFSEFYIQNKALLVLRQHPASYFFQTPFIKQLILALRDGGRYVSESAVEVIGRLGAPILSCPEVVRGILAALRGRGTYASYRAIRAIGELGAASLSNPEFVRGILAALSDSDGNVRCSAVSAIGKLGAASLSNPEVVRGIFAALRGSDGNVRDSAARAIEHLGVASLSHEAIVAGLVRALRDGDGNVRDSAARAIGHLGAASLSHEAIVAGLVRALRDGDGNVRDSAARAIGHLGAASLSHQAIVAGLVALFGDDEKDVKQSAAYAVGQLGASVLSYAEVVLCLAALLGDDEKGVKQSAAYAVGQLGASVLSYPEVVLGLVALLGDDGKYVRESAARAVGQLGAGVLSYPEVVLGLVARLADDNKEHRRYFIEAVSQLGPNSLSHPDLLLGLTVALHDDNWEIRQSAVEAVGRLGASSLSHPDFLLGLTAALHDNHNDVKFSALDVVGWLGVESFSYPSLISGLAARLILGGSSIRVRSCALEVVGWLGVESLSHPSLVSGLAASLHGDGVHTNCCAGKIRNSAVLSMCRLGAGSLSHPELVAGLTIVLCDKKWGYQSGLIRSSAVEVVGRLGAASLSHADLVEGLIASLSDGEDQVRRAAIEATARLCPAILLQDELSKKLLTELESHDINLTKRVICEMLSNGLKIQLEGNTLQYWQDGKMLKKTITASHAENLRKFAKKSLFYFDHVDLPRSYSHSRGRASGFFAAPRVMPRDLDRTDRTVLRADTASFYPRVPEGEAQSAPAPGSEAEVYGFTYQH